MLRKIKREQAQKERQNGDDEDEEEADVDEDGDESVLSKRNIKSERGRDRGHQLLADFGLGAGDEEDYDDEDAV
jgi:hypothetical protein